MKEKSITIRVTEELHTKVRIRIAKEGLTLKQYIINLIEKDLKESK